MNIGKAHELCVADELRSRDWMVDEFGMGLFSEEMRDAFHHLPYISLVRWLPDMVCARRRANGEQVVLLVDAKSQISETPNHSLELNAKRAAAWMSDAWHLPFVYVWGDMTCNFVHDLRPVRYFDKDTRVNVAGGSGTPFLLVRKADQRHLDEIFGRVVQEAVA